MPNVMQQNGNAYIKGFLIADLNSFYLQGMDGLVHEVKSAHGMMKAGMQRSGIYHISHP